MINVTKLTQELRAAGVTTHGNCNSKGIVWDDDNNEIQDRPDVAAILAAHDPIEYSLSPASQIIAANGTESALVAVKAVPDSDVTLLINETPYVVQTDSTGQAVTEPISCSTPGLQITITGQSGELASCQALIFAI